MVEFGPLGFEWKTLKSVFLVAIVYYYLIGIIQTFGCYGLMLPLTSDISDESI